MKESLKISITQWEHSKPKSGLVKLVQISESKVASGKYEIVLKMSTTVTDMAQSEKVSLTRKISTAGQSPLEDADVSPFKACAQQLERDFEKKCSVTLIRLARMQNPDSLNERNPY